MATQSLTALCLCSLHLELMPTVGGFSPDASCLCPVTPCRPRSAFNPGGVWHADDHRGDDMSALSAQRTALYIPDVPPHHSSYSTKYTPPAYTESEQMLFTIAQQQVEVTPRHQDGSSTLTGGYSTAAGYSPLTPGRTAVTPRQYRAGSTGRRRPASACAATRVPKTLGLAVCAGCNAKVRRRGV
jgi:hypothetical protein